MNPNAVFPATDLMNSSKNPIPRKALAVSVRNAHKTYQKGSPILNDLSMSVPKGCIYSLLGSSGCGKSTLLNCCIGLGKLDKGEILMFGFKPGTKESGVPGQRIGFMPQELALYNELTLQEAFSFYGRVFGLNREQIVEAIEFLIKLLDLPKSTRKIAALSGGQKRRVSLAIALIHGPELLILDEPTVGVDAVLRECIWKHLVKQVETKGTTVIITTHYVDEARQSNLIGIMRNGRLLEEDSPTILLQDYGMDSLQDLVVAISRLDAEKDMESIGGEDDLLEAVGDKNAIIVKYMRTIRSVEKKQEIFIVEEELAKPLTLGGDPGSTENISTTLTKITALLLKNFAVLLRNVGFLLFLFILPASQMILISLAIGADPKDISIGVVNGESCDFESESWRSYQLKSCPLTKFGENGSLSCLVLAMLPPDIFIYEKVPTVKKALERVQGGYTYGYFNFPKNYTLNVECKIGGGDGHCGRYETQVKPGSIITLTQDMTSKAVSANIKRLFLDGYLDSMKMLKDICKRNLIANLLSQMSDELPFEFGDPIYGKDDMNFNDFLAPGLLLALLFFFPLCCSAVSHIAEKKSGTLDRAIVAGIGSMEFIAGYFVIQVGVMLIQTGISFLILHYVFEMTIFGNFGLALLLTIMVGVSGMVMGFLVGTLCKDEFEAMMLALGFFFPNILLAGICWPLEAMAKVLRVLSFFFPCTLASESIRSVINRGWSFGHKNVWPGFLSTFCWTVVYVILTVLAHKRQHRI